MLARTLAIMTEVFGGFPQSVQANAGIVLQLAIIASIRILSNSSLALPFNVM
jgi:hypothetical protein